MDPYDGIHLRIYRAHFSYDPVADPLLAEKPEGGFDMGFSQERTTGNTRGTTVPKMAIEQAVPSGKFTV